MVAARPCRPATPSVPRMAGAPAFRPGARRLRTSRPHAVPDLPVNRSTPPPVPAGFATPAERAAWERLRGYAERAGVAPEAADGAHGPILVPHTLSALDDPAGVLAVAEQIVARALGPAEVIRLDMRRCAQTDLCGEALCYALARAAYDTGKGVDGDPPELLLARGVIPAWGTPRLPGVDEDELVLPLTEEPCPPGLTDHERSARVNAHVEKIMSRLARRFAGQTLEQELADRLSSCLAEVVTNAITHGDGGWLSAASYRRMEGDAHGRCQIAMFNYGPTLAGTLRETADEALRAQCQELEEEHRRAGYFDAPHWDPAAFWTVAALQDAISRLGSPRGSGFYTILHFLEYAAERSRADLAPRMCILSGNTHVLVDGRFKQIRSSGRTRANKYDIAFNFPNDLRRPPNPSAVTVLPRFFPGVCVSLHFYITAAHLQATRGDYGTIDDAALGKLGRRDY